MHKTLLQYILPSLFLIFAICTTEIAYAQDLTVSTIHTQYKLGDIMPINITNTGNSTAIFNYEIMDEQKNILAKKCVLSDDTSDILAGQTRTILLDTACVGSDALGGWTVLSKLTYNAKLGDLFSSAGFDIVTNIFSCGMDDCTDSKDFLDQNNMPIHFQNNTGWNQEKFSRSALYLFSDNFGNMIIPITTDGNYLLDIKTNQISFLDIVKSHESLYTYISGIDKTDPIYSKIIDESYIEFFPEKRNMITFSFPNMFNLDFSSDLVNLDLDDIATHNGTLIDGPTIPSFGNSNMFTYDFFFIKQLESSMVIDDTHTHITIPKDRSNLSIFSSFNGTFIDNTQGFSFYDYIFSPLKQTQNGVELHNIICKDHLQLVSCPDGSPACIKPESIQKLIQRGWSTSTPTPDLR